MPILHRYALQSFIRIFLLSICCFVGVLIIARFKEMARFAALSGNVSTTALFVVYHIPTILPVAIPISALLASFLFSQKTSSSFELIALRAAGLSLKKIFFPLFCFSFFLSIVSFFISAEIAPFCRREGKTLLFHETTSNPLLLLQRQKLIKIKDTYLSMKAQDDNLVKNLLFITPNESSKQLSLFFAKKLWLNQATLLGKDLTLISYLPNASGFDRLFLENEASMSTAAPLLSKAIKKNRPRLDINGLSFKMLFFYEKPKQAHVEMLRRLSISLSAFSFTLLGLSFGAQEGRSPKKKYLFYALFLSLSVLMSSLLGKEFKNSPTLASLIFFLPHPLVIFCSFYHLRRLERGKLG